MKHITNFISKLFFISILFGLFSFSLPSQKNEVKIAAWNHGAFEYYLPNGIKYQIEQFLADSLNIGGTIDSISISDPDPHNSESVPYLQYFITNHGQPTFFAHRVVKRLNTSTDLWSFL